MDPLLVLVVMEDVVVLFMLGALVVLLLYHALVFSLLAFGKTKGGVDRDLPVSVVVCARNEAHNLEELIPILMEQDHKEVEVVVVNDRSQDDTGEVLEWMRPKYERLRIVTIQADEKFSYGKKIALGVGVRAAKHPNILVTDADCRPVSRDWIALMAAGFSGGKRIVVGHSPYEQGPGMTNMLERYDGIAKAIQYISFAKAGVPYMGVGRNLAYSQEEFFNSRGKGARRHEQLMSGDDDLFINRVARGRSTTAVVHPDSFMITRASSDFGTWFRRKRRHYTTARYYRFGHQLLLTAFPLARILFWIALVLSAYVGAWLEFALALFVKLFVFLPVTLRSMKRLGADRELLVLALPLEWVFLALDPIIYISTMIIKPRKWK